MCCLKLQHFSGSQQPSLIKMDRAARVARAAIAQRYSILSTTVCHGTPWHTNPPAMAGVELHRKCQQTHARNSAVQCISVHFIVVQCSVVQCSAVLKCKVQSARHSKRQHCKPQCIAAKVAGKTSEVMPVYFQVAKMAAKTERLGHICKANAAEWIAV